MASEVAATAASAARRAAKEFTGVVVSAGKMDKTFKIKLGGMRYEPRVQKVRYHLRLRTCAYTHTALFFFFKSFFLEHPPLTKHLLSSPPNPQWFKAPRYKLVHDPANSVRQGDVVAIEQSWRVSQHVRHVVKHIIAPYGPGIDERPPVPTLEERIAERAERRAIKDARRDLLRRSAALHLSAEHLLQVSNKTANQASKAIAKLTQSDGPANDFGGVD